MAIKDFHYFNPCDIYLGDDVLSNLPALIEGRKVLIVSGGMGTKASGIVDDVTTILSENDIEWVELGGSSTPSYERVQAGIEICHEANIECVLGVGGCSCMDLAKIIAFGACHDDLEDYLFGGKEASNDEDHLLIGVIPSYPSGGSEADSSAEVDDLVRDEHGSLYGIYPDFSLLNPEYSFSLNVEHTAYAAAVTFIQASVNYLGDYSPISEQFTKAVLNGVRDSVQKVLANPRDYDARATQMWCSALATMGILSCGKGDSWSWSIYSDMDIITQCMDLSYRQAITVLFPRWLQTYATYFGDDVRRYMVDIMGVDGNLPIEEAVQQGVDKLIAYFQSLGLPMQYSAFGEVPDEDQLHELAEEYLSDEDDEEAEEANDADDEEESDEDDIVNVLDVDDIVTMYLCCY